LIHFFKRWFGFLIMFSQTSPPHMMYLPLMVLLVGLGGLALLYNQLNSTEDLTKAEKWELYVSEASEVTIDMTMKKSGERDSKCHLSSNCFDVYRCGRSDGKLKVYVYPPVEYYTPTGKPVLEMSEEYYEMLEAIYVSDFYTSDPENACLFVPFIDLLQIHTLSPGNIGRALQSLEFWNNGKNHLLVNIVPSPYKTIPSDQAILASGNYNDLRHGYDIPVPVLSHYRQSQPSVKKIKLLSYLETTDKSLIKTLIKSSPDKLLRIPKDTSKYLKMLGQATFCLITIPSIPVNYLTDCMAVGSVPVIVSPMPVTLPFSYLVDWLQISLQFRPSSASSIVSTLEALSPHVLHKMKSKIKDTFDAHFATPAKVMLNTLTILERKIFSWTYDFPPLAAIPALSPPNSGFTALILTYDRLESLFQAINKVSQAPSLSRVVVVWNHQTNSPPPVDEWPKITKPLKVIQTSANKLSNRFYPYSEIDTECVLSMDDDISMLTTDELEFGYQVWREFPDRIVGFPSRTHVYDNDTKQYKYESEWTNNLSMVLTGVSFYHKYWHYLYTASLSKEQKEIKDWVDKHINCEDIAFNLMVANTTGKAPIKVGPRKKFKCSTPSCENAGMLSAAASYLEVRSKCLDNFLKLYGVNPLASVEFRADPVLYKDNFPENLKLFKDIGSL